MSTPTLNWMLDAPYVQQWHIDDTHIDHYQHVNNVAYLSQLESLAWAHSNALGLQFADYQSLNRGMVIKRHELNYHPANTSWRYVRMRYMDSALRQQTYFETPVSIYLPKAKQNRI